MELTGAEILVRCLTDEGIEYVFGYPGGAALHIYDVLYQQEKVKHILVRHEQGATHAADGYARVTGKAGVVLITSGPGVTNTSYRNRDGLYGFHPNGRIFGSGSDSIDWRRCVSRGGHNWNHTTLR